MTVGRIEVGQWDGDEDEVGAWWAGRLALRALVVAFAGSVIAQSVATSVPPVGTELRVLLHDSTRERGTLVDTTAREIVLRRAVGAGRARTLDRTVPFDSIVAASRQTGTRWRTGVIVGAAVGLVGIAIASDQVLAHSDPGTCSIGCWAGVLGFGSAAGGPLGAFVGRYIGQWEPVPG